MRLARAQPAAMGHTGAAQPQAIRQWLLAQGLAGDQPRHQRPSPPASTAAPVALHVRARQERLRRSPTARPEITWKRAAQAPRPQRSLARAKARTASLAAWRNTTSLTLVTFSYGGHGSPGGRSSPRGFPRPAASLLLDTAAFRRSTRTNDETQHCRREPAGHGRGAHVHLSDPESARRHLKPRVRQGYGVPGTDRSRCAPVAAFLPRGRDGPFR